MIKLRVSLLCVCIFLKICIQYVCLRCANVYACVRAPVSITFYRLVDKSIFFTCIAAAAGKRADLQWWESTASSASHRQQSTCTHGKSFLRAVHCIFRYIRSKQVPIVTWPLTFVCAPQSSELISMHLQSYDSQCAVSLVLLSLLYSFECNLLFEFIRV